MYVNRILYVCCVVVYHFFVIKCQFCMYAGSSLFVNLWNVCSVKMYDIFLNFISFK